MSKSSSTKSFSLLGTLQYFLDPSHTKLGFRVRRGCFWNKKDLSVNLDGKVAVITGANSGIGRATAHGLASRAAEVHLLCRSKERGTAALETIRQDEAVQNGKVHLHIVDLSEPAQIKDFAREFKANHGKLDILVNNAAVMPNELKINSQGLEVALATNLVGFYGLTVEMSDLLKKSDDGGRIVNVVSAGMFTARLQIPTIRKGLDVSKWTKSEVDAYSGLALYAQHHRARVMLTDHFAHVLKDSNVSVNSVHPGWVDTPGLQGAKDMASFYNAMGNMLRTEEEGADTVVWLAIAEKAKGVTGKYFFDRKSRRKNKLGAGTASTPEELQQLVNTCDEAYKS